MLALNLPMQQGRLSKQQEPLGVVRQLPRRRRRQSYFRMLLVHRPQPPSLFPFPSPPLWTCDCLRSYDLDAADGDDSNKMLLRLGACSRLVLVC